MIGLLLRHPAMRPLKRATRNVWWRCRGLAIANPPMPRRVDRVLFVCLGNICRSPFAAAIAVRRHVPGLTHWPITFASAGIRTIQAAEPPAEARAAATGFGVSLAGHRPQALTPALVEGQDLVVVMEAHQRDQVLARYPELRGRVFLLSLFDDAAAGADRFNIADPFGSPAENFEACYRRIDRAVVAMLNAIALAQRRTGTTSGRHQ